MFQTKKRRQGPTESATLFGEGTTKKGNDGNMWTIIVTDAGVHRWSRTGTGTDTGTGTSESESDTESDSESETAKRPGPKDGSPPAGGPGFRTTRTDPGPH
jgi:hypothetical protein